MLCACHRGTASDAAIAPAAAPAQTPHGNPDEATTDLPPEYAKTLPIYPGAKVDHVRKPKGAMREILFSSDAHLDALISFYKDSLNKAGFEITSALRLPGRKTWSCDFHKSGQQASIMLFPSDNDPSRTTIDLIYEIPSKNPEPTEPQEVFDVVGAGEPAPITPNGAQKRN